MTCRIGHYGNFRIQLRNNNHAIHIVLHGTQEYAFMQTYWHIIGCFKCHSRVFLNVYRTKQLIAFIRMNLTDISCDSTCIVNRICAWVYQTTQGYLSDSLTNSLVLTQITMQFSCHSYLQTLFLQCNMATLSSDDNHQYQKLSKSHLLNNSRSQLDGVYL